MATTFCEWSFSASIPAPGPPPSGIYNNSINGAYHDIDPSVGWTGAACDINYAVLGTAPCRTFVVNYYEIPHYDPNIFVAPCNSLETTQQIVLYETTNAIEVYISNKPTCNSWNNGNAVIIDGFLVAGTVYEHTEIGIYDIGNDSWISSTITSPLPYSAGHMGSDGEYLYVGQDYSFYRYDPPSNNWTDLHPTGIFFEAGFAGMAYCVLIIWLA